MKAMSKLIILFLAGAFVWGCATSEELTQARRAYSEAVNDPVVARNGAAALNDARAALEKAYEADTYERQINYAYVARRNVELARIQAEQAQTQSEMAQLRDQAEQLAASAGQQQAEQELRAYRSEPQEMMPQIDRPHFGFDESQLRPGIKPDIGQLSEYLTNNQDLRVLVEGYTDSIGTQEYNEKLGQRRAESVAEALQADGVSSDRIITRSLGEKFPVATNETAAGRQQNRRAEITILEPGQNPENVGKKADGM